MPSTIFLRMSKDSYFRMGYFYQMQGDLHAAAECYIRSIEKNPNAEAHTFLAWVLCQMGAIDDAIQECKKALALDPNFGNAWNDLGAYEMEKRNLDEAVRCFKKACKAKNYDNREFPHYNLGRVYMQKELLLSARKELEEALKINPSFDMAKMLYSNLNRYLH